MPKYHTPEDLERIWAKHKKGCEELDNEDGNEPQWIAECPTVPGFYWFRAYKEDPSPVVFELFKNSSGVIEIFEVGSSDSYLRSDLKYAYPDGAFYSVRIEGPR